MSPAVRVIGIGQPTAGDDAVGLAVADAVSRQAPAAAVEVWRVVDPSNLVFLLDTPAPVILVDALVGEQPPGTVLVLPIDQLSESSLARWSSHGINVVQAVKLAQTLSPDGCSPSIHVVGVAILPPPAPTEGLSPAVAAAVPDAVKAVLTLIGG